MTSTLSEWQQLCFQNIYVLALHTTAFTWGAHLHGVASCNLAVDTLLQIQNAEHKRQIESQLPVWKEKERKPTMTEALSSFTPQCSAKQCKRKKTLTCWLLRGCTVLSYICTKGNEENAKVSHCTTVSKSWIILLSTYCVSHKRCQHPELYRVSTAWFPTLTTYASVFIYIDQLKKTKKNMQASCLGRKKNKKKKLVSTIDLLPFIWN